MHKHTVFLFDMFLTESVGESKELCTFVRTIHHTTTSMNLRLILLYCLLLQFLIPTYGYGKGYFTATNADPNMTVNASLQPYKYNGES